MNVGDKLYCKYNTINLIKGRMYYLTRILDNSFITISDKVDGVSIYTIKDHFYTEKEMRKLKIIKRLNIL